MTPQVIVLDTNQLVSALLTSVGPPAQVVDLVLAGELVVAYDDRILFEWRDVLLRDKFGFSPTLVTELLDFIEREGVKVRATMPVHHLPDADDMPFLEVARASDAILITGNLKHYPPESRHGVRVMGPAEFLRLRSAGH